MSLHAHTWYSREPLTFAPGYASRMPFVRSRLERHLEQNRQRGRIIDFSRAFWRPPLSPLLVYRSEVHQIASLVGLDPVVSLTDHDSIKAGQILRGAEDGSDVPVSLEWTVPFDRAEFHLGVHNLPPGQANAIMRELVAFSAGRCARSLAALLEWVGEDPGVLVVLNHPFWDLKERGEAQHRSILLDLMRRHAGRIHALEVNGYRDRAENELVLRLAEDYGMPAVSGGDRHGRMPNAVLNLTHARTFDEFAQETRDGKPGEILLTPDYGASLSLRKLRVAADVLRHDPGHAYGCCRWIDRVFYPDEGPIRPLRDHWPGGPPPWLETLVRVVTGLPCGALARLSRLAPRRPLSLPVFHEVCSIAGVPER